VNTHQRKHGYTLMETIVAITIVAILMGMLLPGLAMSRNRAKRMMCANNIKQIGIAFVTYAGDNEVKFPWLIVDVDKQAQGMYGEGAYRTDILFGLATIRVMLGTAKVLASPCDPDVQRYNEEVDLVAVTNVPDRAHSYGLACGSGVYQTQYHDEVNFYGTTHNRVTIENNWELPHELGPRFQGYGPSRPDQGGDFIRGTTILTMTRNISGPLNRGDSLSNQTLGNPDLPDHTKYAYWLGYENNSDSNRTMAGLRGNQGQIGLADGSAHTTSDRGLMEWAQSHHSDDFGIYAGAPSPIIDTPNVEVELGGQDVYPGNPRRFNWDASGQPTGPNPAYNPRDIESRKARNQ